MVPMHIRMIMAETAKGNGTEGITYWKKKQSD